MCQYDIQGIGFAKYCNAMYQAHHNKKLHQIQQGIFVHTTAAHWIFSLFQTILCKP